MPPFFRSTSANDELGAIKIKGSICGELEPRMLNKASKKDKSLSFISVRFEGPDGDGGGDGGRWVNSKSDTGSRATRVTKNTSRVSKICIHSQRESL